MATIWYNLCIFMALPSNSIGQFHDQMHSWYLWMTLLCFECSVTIISSRNFYTLAVTTRRCQTDALSGLLTWNPFKEWTFLLQKQAFKRFHCLMCDNCWIKIGFNLNTVLFLFFFLHHQLASMYHIYLCSILCIFSWQQN